MEEEARQQRVQHESVVLMKRLWTWVTKLQCKRTSVTCIILMRTNRQEKLKNRSLPDPEPGVSGSGSEKEEERSLAEFLLTTGQADKSARGMPWHQEPKKDATSCDKLRGAAHTHRSGDFRMGKPGRAILCQRALNKIGVRGERPELKHLSRGRKRHQPRFRK